MARDLPIKPPRPVARSPSGSRIKSVPPLPPSRPVPAEPTVLVVGARDQMLYALKAALGRHQVFVESATLASIGEAVVAAAPDLVVLAGDAAEGGGLTALDELARSPRTALIPVALLGDNPDLATRLDAFRHGAAAIIPRSASIDAVAARVAELAREIPARPGAGGKLGEATLEELVQTLARDLKSGILSVSGSTDGAPVRLVLDRGRPLATLIDDFVKRVRDQVVTAEPLRYEFDERAAGTIDVLDLLPEAPESELRIEGVRVVLVDDDAPRADAVAQALRARGALVVVSDLLPSDLHLGRVRQHDPAVLVIGVRHLQGAGYSLIERTRRDTRLRWASLLAVNWDELWHDGELGSVTHGLLDKVQELTQAERQFEQAIARGEAFDSRLEGIGPARLLRALARSPRPLRASVVNPRFKAVLHVAEGLIAGAEGHALGDDRAVEGPAALATLLVLGSGRVHVERAEHVGSANVMSPPEVALAEAEREAARVTPSIGAPEPRADERAYSPVIPRQPTLPSFPPLSSSHPSPPPLVSSAPPAPPAPSAGPPGLVGEQPTVRPPSPAEVAEMFSSRFESELPTRVRPNPLGAPDNDVVPLRSDPIPPSERPTMEPDSFELFADQALTRQAPPARPRWLWPMVGGAAFVLGFGLMLALLPSYVAPAPRRELPRTDPKAEAPLAPPPLTTGAAPGATTAAAPAEPATPPATGAVAAPAPALAREPLAHVAACTSDGGETGAVALGAARRAIVAGDLTRAAEEYCRGVTASPASVAAWAGLVNTLLMLGDGERALAELKRAQERHPLDGTLRALLVDAQALSGDLDEARRTLLAERDVDAGDATRIEKLAKELASRGDLALGRKDLRRAERFFRKSLALTPSDASAMLRLARVLQLQGASERAAYWRGRAGSPAPL